MRSPANASRGGRAGVSSSPVADHSIYGITTRGLDARIVCACGFVIDRCAGAAEARRLHAKHAARELASAGVDPTDPNAAPATLTAPSRHPHAHRHPYGCEYCQELTFEENMVRPRRRRRPSGSRSHGIGQRRSISARLPAGGSGDGAGQGDAGAVQLDLFGATP